MKKMRRASRSMLSVPHCCLAVLSASIGSAAFAQQALTQIVPSVNLTETVTSNVNLRREDPKSDWITLLSPSVFATSRGGRVEGSLQAALNSAHYANDDTQNRNFLTLRGSGRVEAWEKRGFVDLSASVSREILSALGARPGDNLTGNSNQGQVRNFLVSPYLTGRFGSTGKADLRYTFNVTESDSSVLQNTRRNTLAVDLTDPRALGAVGWALSLADSATQTTGKRDLNTQSARATGLIQVDPQVVLRLIVGTEKNNYRSEQDASATILGVGADWTLSPLTKFSGLWEDRFFGPGYLFTGEHRRGRFLLTGSYSKDVSTTSQSLNTVSMFDTFESLMQIARIDYPNASEAQRAAAVRKFMLDGQWPDTLGVKQSVLSNGVFLDRRLRLALTLLGDRTSLLMAASRSERNNLTDQSFALGGDFQQTDRLTETGASVNVSHRLTPLSSANVGLTFTRSHRASSVASAAQSSRGRIFNAALMTRFTPKVSGSLTFRNNQGEGLTPYTENALIGSVAIGF